MKKLLVIAVAICLFSAGAMAQDQNEVTVNVKNMPIVVATNLGKATVADNEIMGFGAEKSFVVSLNQAPTANGSNIPVFAYANHPCVVKFSFVPFWREEKDYSGGSAAATVIDHLDTKFELTLHYTDINTDPANVSKMSGWAKDVGVSKETTVNAAKNFHPHDGLIRGDLGFTVRTVGTNKFSKDDNAMSPDAGLYTTTVYIDYLPKPYTN
jgi:hypothetical protein